MRLLPLKFNFITTLLVDLSAHDGDTVVRKGLQVPQTLLGKEKLDYNLVGTSILDLWTAGSIMLEVLWEQDWVYELQMQSGNSGSPTGTTDIACAGS